MRAPREAPHGVLVSAELEDGPCGITQVPCANHFVDAGGREDVWAVLVPVVCQHLCGGGGGDGDECCGLRGGRAEVEETEGAVGGDGGEDVWRVRGEERGVGAGGCGQGLERALGLRGPLWLGRQYVGGEGGRGGRGGQRGTRTILTDPSHEAEQNVDLSTRFQLTENTSRVCSCHDATGRSASVVSNSLIEPSPDATASWFSCSSENATS